MKLTFLGTGTSTGVPQIGCHCDTCTSTDARDSRLRTSAIVTTDSGANILIDCGPDFRTQILGVGSPDLELDEVDDAASIVRENADPDATIIFGAAIDESLNDEMRITIIATGFEDDHPNMIEGGTPKEQPRAARPQGIDAELPFNRTAPQKAKTEQPAPETQGFSEEYERILAMLRGS